MDKRTHQLLVSLLCSLMLMSSQSSMNPILADVGSGIAIALGIAAGVAGVKPDPSDVPPVKSVKTVPVKKETKSADETPLNGVAMAGRTFGEDSDLNSNTARLFGGLGFEQGATVPARILNLLVDRRGRVLYVIQRTPDSPVYIVFANVTPTAGTFYLTSPRGELVGAVRREPGGRFRRLDITAAYRRSFDDEKKFWQDKERELSAQASRQATSQASNR